MVHDTEGRGGLPGEGLTLPTAVAFFYGCELALGGLVPAALSIEGVAGVVCPSCEERFIEHSLVGSY